MACGRELVEELDIDVMLAHRWITRTFEYSHASVRLNFHRVVRWRGTEGVGRPAIHVAGTDALNVEPMLPANGPILKALSLPTVYAISKGEAEAFNLGHRV